MFMEGKATPVLVYPRFTTFFGTDTYRGHAMNVVKYDSMSMNMWIGPQGGTGGASTKISFWQSMDRITWRTFTGGSVITPTPGVETSFDTKLDEPWLRVHVELLGTAPAITLWCEGFLFERET